MEGLTHHLLH